MTKYQELIKKSEEAMEKSRMFREKGDEDMASFWLKVANENEERARSLAVGDAQ